MALDTAPKLRRKRRLAAKLEVTNGVAVSLAAANGTTPVFNPELRFETEAVDRENQGALAPVRQGRGARSGRVTFETELYGAGASPPVEIDVLLRTCGMLNTAGVYTPLDGATETVTIGLYRDGLLKTLAGCMGAWTMTLRRGQAPRVAWDFRGVQCPPTDTAIISPTFDTTIAPRVGASVFTIGGTTYRVPELVVEFGNEVVMREDITAVDSASEPTGYRSAYITNRTVRVRCAPESLPIASVDFWDMARDGTTVALAATIGASAGNQWTLAAPSMQLVSDPDDLDRDGILATGLEFVCTNVGGATEFTLTHVGS